MQVAVAEKNIESLERELAASKAEVFSSTSVFLDMFVFSSWLLPSNLEPKNV